MRKKDRRRKVIVSWLLVLLFMLGCSLSGQPFSVTVSEIGTCHDYDRVTREPIDIATQFTPDIDQITVYFYVETSLQADVTYHWWLDDDLVAEFQAPLEQGYNFGWVTPKGTFPEGEYKVDIMLGEVTLRSTLFQVVSP